eukprot:COSAG02_NODE_12606_length_1520_cov_1.686840_2_plen_291_part_01
MDDSGVAAGTPVWQARVDNLCRRFPTSGQATVVAALHAQDGHAGQAASLLQRVSNRPIIVVSPVSLEWTGSFSVSVISPLPARLLPIAAGPPAQPMHACCHVMCAATVGERQKLMLRNPSPDRDACYKLKTTQAARYAVQPAQALLPAGATVEVDIVLAKIDSPSHTSTSTSDVLRDRFLIQAGWHDDSAEKVQAFWQRRHTPSNLFNKKVSSQVFLPGEMEEGQPELEQELGQAAVNVAPREQGYQVDRAVGKLQKQSTVQRSGKEKATVKQDNWPLGEQRAVRNQTARS